MNSIASSSVLCLFFAHVISAFYYDDNVPYLYNDALSSSPNNVYFRLMNRNPLTALNNRFFIRNPNFSGLASTFDSCTNSDGESGVCLPAAACSLYAGRPSGACAIGSVCCINTISKCSGVITLNNTYWQSTVPSVLASAPLTCSVNVRLDQSLLEQRRYPICQLRLDFIQFVTAQPSSSSVCEVDTFRVSADNNRQNIICGDNDGQHMYIHLPSSGEKRSDVEMTFSFGANSATSRSWNIKVSMIPCGASYAARADCLQYFTGATGTLKSFNWRDSAVATRKLANQHYTICIRSELVGGERANNICYQPCTVNTPSTAFSVTGSSAGILYDYDCPTDHFLVLGNGEGDRMCGATGSSDTFQACSSIRPFKVYYMTDDSETDNVDNVGFCVTYAQRTV